MPPHIKSSGNEFKLTGRIVGLSVFFISFAAYLFTLAPTITYWDSGELTVGAFSLGLPHPPAYPIFCMLGHLFTWLPFGSVGYRVNLQSAFFGAATVYLLYFFIRKLTEGRPGAAPLAASFALLFASFASFWGVSVITEVYTLNTFLLLSTVTAVLYYERMRDYRYLLLSSFLAGLALVMHQSNLFLLPPFAAYFLLSEKNYKKIHLVAAGAFLFLLAYSVNIYLPIRASQGPLLNIGDPIILPWFGWVMKWGIYFDSLKGVFSNAENIISAKLLLAAGGAGGLVLLAYFLRRRPLLLFLICSVAFYAFGIYVFTGGGGSDRWGLAAKFYIPAVLLAVPLAAEALSWAAGRLDAGGNAAKGISAAVLAGAIALSYAGFRQVDNSRNFFAFDFGMNTLKSVGQDAALFGYGDNGVFPVWYLQKVEHYRNDIGYFYPETMEFPWGMADAQQLLLRKYGIKYTPSFPLSEIKGNVSILRLMLERVAPTYFDYSTMRFLDAPFEHLTPQGLVHLAPSWPGVPVGMIWDRYVLRGVLDDSTNKDFAAEGTLEIYAWECVVWAQTAYNQGHPAEAIKAYGYAKKMGLFNEYLDKWVEGLKEGLREGKR